MTDTREYPKCIYMTSGDQCDQDAVQDGLCSTHIVAVQEHARIAKEIESLLDEFDGIASKKIITDEIMNRIVGPTLDTMWDFSIAQFRSARLNAKTLSNQTRDKLVALAVARKAKEAEEGLRKDFGELAKDLEKSIKPLAFKLGSRNNPLLRDLNSWQSTAEVLADKELSDQLQAAKDSPIQDFGPVPRPEPEPELSAEEVKAWFWSCPVHRTSGATRFDEGTAYCAEKGCSHNSEESS